MKLRDLIVAVQADRNGAALLYTRDDTPAPGIPQPGQKGRVFVFRVVSVPSAVSSGTVAGRVLAGFEARSPEPPGREWHVAYNISWERLRLFGLEAEAPGIGLDAAAAVSGRGRSGLVTAMAAGRLPVTRVNSPRGGKEPPQVNPADLGRYLLEYPLKPGGRPRKPPE